MGKNPIKFEVSERKEIMNIRREIKQIEKCTTREKNQWGQNPVLGGKKEKFVNLLNSSYVHGGKNERHKF